VQSSSGNKRKDKRYLQSSSANKRECRRYFQSRSSRTSLLNVQSVGACMAG